ncbi:hypothetical protein MTO96_022848 [Rhipicephalus appendiculatus]
MVTRITELCPEVTKIMATLVLPRTPDRRRTCLNRPSVVRFNREVGRFNNLLRAHCCQSSMLFFFDHALEWLPPGWVLAADGVHPSFEGAALIAGHLRSPLLRNMEAEAEPPYTCRQCERITAVQAEMVAMMKEHAERCTSRMDELTAKLDREIAERRQEGDFLRLQLREEKQRSEALQEQIAKAKLATVAHATVMAAQAPARPPQLLKLQLLDQGIIKSLRVGYRRRVLDMLLVNLQMGTELKVDMLGAIQMMTGIWQDVKETVAKRFWKAGFVMAEPFRNLRRL